MAMTDVSKTLLDGMVSALDVWAERFGGKDDALYWVLRMKTAETHGVRNGDYQQLLAGVPGHVRDDVVTHLRTSAKYWDNIRYASLDPVTQLWGTIVNSVRVAAGTDVVTDEQRITFDFSPESLLSFLRAARERMEVADALYHAFKPMPAPECQALAALLNVHVDARLDVELMCRLVRLLDAEGPLTEEESAALASLANTHLVDAAFRGLRGCA